MLNHSDITTICAAAVTLVGTSGTVLAALVTNRRDSAHLLGRMDGMDKRRDGMDRRMDGLKTDIADFRRETKKHFLLIEADLRTFHSITGKHDGRLDALERKQA